MKKSETYLNILHNETGTPISDQDKKIDVRFILIVVMRENYYLY